MSFELVEPQDRLATIRVAGVGGAGGNAINRMIEAGLSGVDFIAVNTDLQALRNSRACQVIQIGNQITRGLGSGGDPNVGRESVLEDEDTLREILADSDMVFVTAGMGGGTGTGAAPVVARVARELGALTVGVVTKPFGFEGKVRATQADEGLDELREAVDTLIVIPNERLLEVVPKNATMSEAFVFADNVLYEATRGIHDIIMKPHVVNLDFADVRSVMENKGVALMGTGKAVGEDRAAQAARDAISSPLLESVDSCGAEGVLVNITGGEIGLMETSTVMSLVQDAAGDQAHIIFGYGIDEDLGDTLQVTVIATGFDASSSRPRIATATVSEELVEEIQEEIVVPLSATVEVTQADDIPAEETKVAQVEQAQPQLRVMAASAGHLVDIDTVAAARQEATEPDETMRFTFGEPDPSPELMPIPSVEELRAIGRRQGVAPPTEESRDTNGLPVSEFLADNPGHEDARPSGGSTKDWEPRPARTPFVSDRMRGELSEPAYVRKYMD
jgi:cell division protein FtsZ